MAHPLYPEVAITWGVDGPLLLSTSDVQQDYSLLEPPIAPTDGMEDTSESPTEGSTCVLDLVQRYLALQPHERANMSVVLFNCDSARLPQAVVDKLGQFHDDYEDVRCQVLLRHVEDQRLRDGVSLHPGCRAHGRRVQRQRSHSRLHGTAAHLRHRRSGATTRSKRRRAPFDIVFSQDVIARHARLHWYVESAEPASIRSLLPSRWSRRKPAVCRRSEVGGVPLLSRSEHRRLVVPDGVGNLLQRRLGRPNRAPLPPRSTTRLPRRAHRKDLPGDP